MNESSNWKLDQARQDMAAQLAESIVAGLGITEPPVDPFAVIASESGRIQALGDDFGDTFDGRMEYAPPRFLLFYNTKYDAWPHNGRHHPKIRFTIGHELGHYFLEPHREYLMKGGGPHGSHTEFESDNAAEREADAFATGLLMPESLLGSVVNLEPPALAAVQTAREAFDVSLTSMMIRWVRLSHYPCAMVSVRDNRIEWGFTSEAFKNAGGYRVNRSRPVRSRSARDFLNSSPPTTYREGEGWGIADNWIDCERTGLEVHEDYVVIPSTQQVLVFLTVEEEDVSRDSEWD